MNLRKPKERHPSTRYEGDGTEVEVQMPAPPKRPRGRPSKSALRTSNRADPATFSMTNPSTATTTRERSRRVSFANPEVSGTRSIPDARRSFSTHSSSNAQSTVNSEQPKEEEYAEDTIELRLRMKGQGIPHQTAAQTRSAGFNLSNVWDKPSFKSKYKRRNDHHPKFSFFEGNLCDENGIPQFKIGEILERTEKTRWEDKVSKNWPFLGVQERLEQITYDKKYSNELGRVWCEEGPRAGYLGHDAILPNLVENPCDERDFLQEMTDSDEEEEDVNGNLQHLPNVSLIFSPSSIISCSLDAEISVSEAPSTTPGYDCRQYR